MYLQLVREDFTYKATEGRLYVNGTFECYTLEDKDRYLEDNGIKIANNTAIPRGIYKVELTMSNRFLKVLPVLRNVPQFTGIRIHSGNTSNDTEGCILVGTVNAKESDNFIGNSRVALAKLMAKLETAEDITLEIV